MTNLFSKSGTRGEKFQFAEPPNISDLLHLISL